MTGHEEDDRRKPSYLRSLSQDEQVARIRELRDTLPKVRRGFGLNQGLFVIRPVEARTWADWERACELERLVGELYQNEVTPDHVVYGLTRTIRSAVRWARKVFHAHGFPSRCWVAYSRRRKTWMIYPQPMVDKLRARKRREADRRYCDYISGRRDNCASKSLCLEIANEKLSPIEKLLEQGHFADAQEGSDWWYANRIIKGFLLIQEYKRGRSSKAWWRRRNRSYWRDDDSDLWESGEPRPVEPLRLWLLMWNCFELGRLWGEAETLQRTETDALAKREEREANRAAAAKAGAKAQREAAQRREAWFAHLDALAEKRRWLLMGEARRRTEAIRSFKATFPERSDLRDLFGRVTAGWYAAAMDQWRLQALEDEGEPQN